ncbi:hypothetical protein THIOM_003030 [Candidatus Thiomargarita nelsonii]|uniref:Uncharacterized protein n=1 Tax=Candidatus Thiomargarita nelsonii TaxID=1003181 RepID=A0A176RZT7_9GAMM|nr:hypothetical protein THIOM_003030 [Candidatus Thiomargarita nelsonii]
MKCLVILPANLMSRPLVPLLIAFPLPFPPERVAWNPSSLWPTAAKMAMALWAWAGR